MDISEIKKNAYKAACHDNISVPDDIEGMKLPDRILYLEMLNLYRLYIIRRISLEDAGKIEAQFSTDYEQLEEALKPPPRKPKKKIGAAKKFTPPTLEEVADYCTERNNGIDPEEFIDANTAKGWLVGKTHTPMKDWKAVVRTWEKRKNQELPKKSDHKPTFDIDEYERLSMGDTYLDKQLGENKPNDI